MAPGITSDQTSGITFATGDLNFSNITTFSLPGTTITSGNTIPVGTKVGGLRSSTNLGIANGGCNTALTVDFLLFNVALPNGVGDPRATGEGGTSTNIAYPRPEGATNRFASWNVGSVDLTTDGVEGDNISVSAPNLLLADAAETAIVNYPVHLLNLFDPDYQNVPPGVDLGSGDGVDILGPIDPVIPQAVYGGITSVLGTWTILYFAQFSEAQSPGISELPGASGLMLDAMGAPSISILNDPGSVVSFPSSITDFCSSLAVQTMLLGDLPGTAINRMTTPAAEGTGLAVMYTASQRDLDQDSYENQIDTCALSTLPNVGNPRGANSPGNGDADSDGLDDRCDPGADFGGGCDPDGAGPLAAVTQDNDSDCFQNHQDNCPIVTNGGPQGSAALNDQKDSEVSAAGAAANPDLGPKGDGIGDICDTGIVSVTQNGITFDTSLTTTLSNGRYQAQANVNAKCIDTPGGADLDLDDDGYCTAQDGQETGSCKDLGSGGNFVIDSCPVRHNTWSSISGNPARVMDTDGDLIHDAQETYMGTDATKACAHTPGTGDETQDNNPFDYNDSGNITTADVGFFVSPLNKPVNNAGGSVRFDLNVDGITTTADVGFFVSILNKWCHPSAPAGSGTMGIPGWSQPGVTWP